MSVSVASPAAEGGQHGEARGANRDRSHMAAPAGTPDVHMSFTQTDPGPSMLPCIAAH
jgi:hypothetical protein